MREALLDRLDTWQCSWQHVHGPRAEGIRQLPDSADVQPDLSPGDLLRCGVACLGALRRFVADTEETWSAVTMVDQASCEGPAVPARAPGPLVLHRRPDLRS